MGAPPAGAMWHHAGVAEALTSQPAPLLDATRVLAHGGRHDGTGAEVLLIVVDRAGDVKETARALLDRRHWLDLIGPPKDIAVEGSASSIPATLFHFRWKETAGLGGDVTRTLWSST